MTKLNLRQSTIHARGIKRARVYAMAERYMIESIIEIEAEEIHKAVGQPLYKYIMKYWKLTDDVALMLIGVARKSKALPALRKAIIEMKITPPRASRLLSAINNDNAEELIEFASTHTKQETDFEVRRLNPLAKRPDKYKVISETHVEVTITITKVQLTEAQRVQSLLAQKQKSAALSDAFAEGVALYLNTQDPVRKAERAFCPDRVKKPAKRVHIKPESNQRAPFTAKEIHSVNMRDKGRCVFVDQHGKRCGCDRWTNIHHIVEVRNGGTNHPDNLITLCSFHHDLVHQLSLPIEGQITWLR